MLQFSGVASVPVAAQSALLAYVDDQLPLSYVSANVTGVAPRGNRTFDVAVQFVIGKSLAAFSPQVRLFVRTSHTLSRNLATFAHNDGHRGTSHAAFGVGWSKVAARTS